MKRKLTTKFIDGLKPAPDRRIEARDTLIPGLLLRVSKVGSKTWYLSKRIDGRARRIRIGRYPVISLAEARDQTRKILYQIEIGDFEANTGIEIDAKPNLSKAAQLKSL